VILFNRSRHYGGERDKKQPVTIFNDNKDQFQNLKWGRHVTVSGPKMVDLCVLW